MTSETIIISIICSAPDADDRPKAIAEIFSIKKNLKVFLILHGNWNEWNSKYGWISLSRKKPLKMDLLFHHTAEGEVSNHVPKEIQYQKIVKFSNDDRRDTTKPEKSICGLPAFKSYSDCPINEINVEEFLLWAKGERSNPPSICFPDRPMDLLYTITLLCQAYLTVHAVYEGDDKDWEIDDIKMALTQMGWIDYLEKEEKERKDAFIAKLEGKKIEIRDSKLWHRILNFSKKDLDGDIERFIEEFKFQWDEEQKRYGPLPDAVLSLFKKFHSSEIAPPKIVTDAYNVIADRLNKRLYNEY